MKHKLKNKNINFNKKYQLINSFFNNYENFNFFIF